MVKGILVTGCGHSGTRLIFDMLSKHNNISHPKLNKINGVREFGKAHKLFVNFMQLTPFNSDVQYFNELQFKNCMDEYVRMCDTKKYILFKLPYYPLNFLDEFIKYFDELKLCYVLRNKDNVIKSFVKRNEHRSFFRNEEMLELQSKKFTVIERQKMLKLYPVSPQNGKEILGKMYDRCIFLRNEWNKNNAKFQFINIDVHHLNNEYFYKKLIELGLAPNNVNEMLKLIKYGRL